jgi:hypothetical protein
MIRALRERHERRFQALAVAIPLLFVAALVVRPSWPTQPSPGPVPSIEAWTEVGPGSGARALIERQSTREWLHLARTDDLVAPDVLVYWAEKAPDLDAPLPDDAVLLGAFGDVGTTTFDLPARGVGGALLLYSLGHSSLVATVPMRSIEQIGEGL